MGGAATSHSQGFHFSAVPGARTRVRAPEPRTALFLSDTSPGGGGVAGGVFSVPWEGRTPRDYDPEHRTSTPRSLSSDCKQAFPDVSASQTGFERQWRAGHAGLPRALENSGVPVPALTPGCPGSPKRLLPSRPLLPSGEHGPPPPRKGPLQLSQSSRLVPTPVSQS